MRDPLDEITELRIELGRVKDQRDAFKAAATKVITDLIQEELKGQVIIRKYTVAPPPSGRLDGTTEDRLRELEGASRAQAIINEANQKDVVKLEGNHEAMDDILDRVSQRVDLMNEQLANLAKFVGDTRARLESLTTKVEHTVSCTCVNQDAILGIRLQLERIEARLKHLEIKGSEPTF